MALSCLVRDADGKRIVAKWCSLPQFPTILLPSPPFTRQDKNILLPAPAT